MNNSVGTSPKRYMVSTLMHAKPMGRQEAIRGK